jgi:hypothetical protein
MPEMLSSIGSFFSSGAGQGIEKLAGLGLAGAGLGGNIAAEHDRSKELAYLQQQQQANASLTPAQLAAKVSQATAPLNAGLVQGVENQVSGSLAEQGLSEAPGIQASVLAQALAPYQQQNQNTALQLVMQQLGLPIQYGQAILGNQPQQSNLTPLLAMLMRNNGNQNQSSNLPGGGWDFLNTIYGPGYNSSPGQNIGDSPMSDPFSGDGSSWG